MPLVQVKFDTNKPGQNLAETDLIGFATTVKIVVATVMSCAGEGKLEPSDIEVHFSRAMSQLDDSDYAVIVTVEARHYRLREHGDPSTNEPDLQQRSDRIAEELALELPDGVEVGCWIKLVNARWSESAAKTASTQSETTIALAEERMIDSTT